MKLNDTHLDNVFFTGCLHLNHKNICKGVSEWDSDNKCRDFENLDEMNNAIIESVNKTVGENDTLFSLGDMFFGDKSLIPLFLSKINCKNIIYIMGNHCKYMLNKPEIKSYFKEFHRYHEIFYKNRLICLFHFPIAVWDEHARGSWHLHSHSHGNYEEGLPTNTNRKILDVGWDVFNRPISLREVRSIMDTKGIEQKDHH